MKDERWFPPLKKRNCAVCPKCKKQKPYLKMQFPYDTDFVPEKLQVKWCLDCISDAAEDQEQRRIEGFYG